MRFVLWQIKHYDPLLERLFYCHPPPSHQSLPTFYSFQMPERNVYQLSVSCDSIRMFYFLSSANISDS